LKLVYYNYTLTSVERDICPIPESIMSNTSVIFQCACAKMSYFYFRSEIWRHHRVPRPRFTIWREIPATRKHYWQKLAYLYLRGFSGPFGSKWRFL